MLRVAVRPVGNQAELGVVAAAFWNDHEPTPIQHLLLNIAANQAATAIHHVHLLRSLRDSEEHGRRINAELEQRVMELQKANVEIQNARRAALKVMEDAVQSRQLVETLNKQLRIEISERELAQGALGQRTAQFETLLNETPLGVYLVDADFRIQQANPTALAAFDITAEQMGQDFDELIQCVWSKEVGDEIVRLFRHTLDTGVPCVRPELIGRRRDREVTEYYEMQIHRIPLSDERHGVVCYFRDISARLQAQAAIAESEERYRTLIEQVKDYAIFRTDTKGLATSWNEGVRWVLGFEEQEFLGMDIASTIFMPEDIQSGVPAEELHTAASKGSASNDRWMRRKDGTRFYAGGITTALHGPAGELIGFTKVMRDHTASKEAQEVLRQMNNELELRVEERTLKLMQSQEQLRALAAELNLAEQRERQRPAADLHDYLGQLLALSRIKLSQAKQLPMNPALTKIFTDVLGITDNALAYTRTLVSQLSPPVLHEFGLSMAIQWLAEQMLQHDLAVSVKLQEEAPPIPEEHALLLFQSVRELLINCVKHAHTRKATIELEQREDMLYITVADQGDGFTPCTGALAAKPDASSPGFGLFSIRERMLSLGGRFDLNAAPGKGTSATLVLPLSKGRDDEILVKNSPGSMVEESGEPLALSRVRTGVPSTNDTQSLNGSRIRVVVADDHAMVRQGLCGLLDEDSAFQVVGEAANGEQAAALADELRPDVILMDVTMPKLDGIEATRLIKLKYPTMVVIAMSVHTAGQVEAAMREAGAAGFINKEAAVDQLVQMIHEIKASTEATKQRP